MATKNSKRANRGGQLLSRVDDSVREIARHAGVSAATAGYWRTGERKPNDEDREKLSERYGIPLAAWDEPPVAMGRPRKEIAAEPAVEPAEATDPVVEIDATLASNAQRLNRMILTDLARLEGTDGAELELGKRAEIMKKLSDAQVALAKATGETTLNLQRIVAHPEFKRVVQKITDAIATDPAMLAKVIAVLEAP